MKKVRSEPYTRASEKYDYEYRDRACQKNGHHVIFVHAYKHQKQWKKFLLKKIMEIEQQRHQRSHENAPSTQILTAQYRVFDLENL